MTNFLELKRLPVEREDDSSRHPHRGEALHGVEHVTHVDLRTDPQVVAVRDLEVESAATLDREIAHAAGTAVIQPAQELRKGQHARAEVRKTQARAAEV